MICISQIIMLYTLKLYRTICQLYLSKTGREKKYSEGNKPRWENYFNTSSKVKGVFFLMRWMKLEPIIQSEVSQKDKHQYSILTHTYGIWKDGNDNPICETERETQMYRTNLWTLWEKARVGCSERTALKQVYYQGWNRSPAQVGCMRQVLRAGALGWPRDGKGREAGGGMGNTCKSMADSCQCMAKTTTIL